jgi:hypothetical protein
VSFGIAVWFESRRAELIGRHNLATMG